MVGGSPGTPASSTTKTGRHDIAEILLKVALKHQNQYYNSRETTYFSCFAVDGSYIVIVFLQPIIQVFTAWFD